MHIWGTYWCGRGSFRLDEGRVATVLAGWVWSLVFNLNFNFAYVVAQVLLVFAGNSSFGFHVFEHCVLRRKICSFRFCAKTGSPGVAFISNNNRLYSMPFMCSLTCRTLNISIGAKTALMHRLFYLFWLKRRTAEWGMFFSISLLISFFFVSFFFIFTKDSSGWRLRPFHQQLLSLCLGFQRPFWRITVTLPSWRVLHRSRSSPITLRSR